MKSAIIILVCMVIMQTAYVLSMLYNPHFLWIFILIYVAPFFFPCLLGLYKWLSNDDKEKKNDEEN